MVGRAPIYRRRWELWELLVIVGSVLAISAIFPLRRPTPPVHPETRALEEQYGPVRNSENEEEWIIRDFFQAERDGFFVDVGANDFRLYSNTYYLETELGWSGLAIEPLSQFKADYLKYRPRTRFLTFFVSDKSKQEATIFLNPKNAMVASSERSFTERWGESDLQEVTVPTITMDDLLQAERVSRIDFMSMDIELAEPKALAGFDIERFRPRFVGIEAHPEVRQEILDYFARHDYVLVGKYLRADEHNLWFAPLKTSRSQ